MHYLPERIVDGVFTPAAAAATLAASGLFDRHVVYERAGEWWFAGGAAGEVVLDRTEVRRHQGDQVHRVPWDSDPFAAARKALAGLGFLGGAAYGWVAFELAYLTAGRRDLPGGAPLLHLMVPHTEVRLGVDRVTVRGVDEATAARVLEVIAASTAVAGSPAPQAIHDEAARYRAMVATAVQDIQAGKLQKVILSRRVPVDVPVDFPATYLRGRAANTPARSFLLDLGGWKAAGFSPETVLEVDPSGWVSTQPLAGTRACGLADEDRRKAELLTDPKEIFEHATSVKLAYDELRAICAPESVAVEDFMTVKSRGSVQHLGSRVSGRLTTGRDCWDALGALFPAVTASGIPKPEAYPRIADLEGEPRGLYAGAVLRVCPDGEMDAALVLRAIFARDGRAWLQAGAGIVADSRPDREYEETCEKLGSVAPYVITPRPGRRNWAARLSGETERMTESGTPPGGPRRVRT